MRYVITWLALAVAIAIGIGSLNWPAYHRMAASGVPGQATVIELLPKIHNTVRYEYHVGGQIFQGQMQSWQPNPPLEQLSIGQLLVIYYDPNNPRASVLGDPKPMLENETISVALATIVIPTFIVLTWAWKSSRRYAKKIANEAA
ncbi:MAG TPA: DUF3592 domain-containing protein [Verrucomicrobiae bacterium]|jgi:Protein of unknown function (DUF3592)